MGNEENSLYRTIRTVYRSVSPALDWIDTLSKLAVHEIENGPSVQMPFTRRLWLWRNGFTSMADVLYDFSEWDPPTYVNSWEFQRSHDINRPWGYIIENKLSLHHLMGQFPGYRPDIYGLLDDGIIKSIEGGNGDDGPVGEWVLSLLREQGSLVLKPVHGYGGDGVHICEWRDEGPVVDGVQKREAEFSTFVSGLEDYLVTQKIQQAEYAETIFPSATNTIRVYTMYDAEAGEPFIPAASHRFGTVASAPVDNWNRNGLAALIDVDTGKLSKGARVSSSNDLRRYVNHPDTGERIQGITIPNWSIVVDAILEMASMFSQVPFLGWDVVLDENHELYVLEANAAPGITTVQIHRPLKTDPRVESFFEQHDI